MLDPQLRRGPVDSAAVYTHSRTRTTSSNIFPPAFPVQGPIPMHPGHAMPQQNMPYSRRSPSVNTFSTSSTMPPPAAYRTSPTTDLRRSTSSRSGGASPRPISYVAALRRQKGTVWCDRAQPEDPALAAQMRAAKAKASRAMLGTPRLSGGSPTGRTSTGISATGKVAAKIRHHGKPTVVGYASGENHVGVGGVPPRLSATEVEGESSDDEDGINKLHHRRTGSSGRNSVASARRNLAYRTSGGLGSSQKQRSPSGTPERAGSLAEDRRESTPTATTTAFTPTMTGPSDAASAKSQSTSTSAERADNVADLEADTALASKSRQHSALVREKSTKNPTDLARRGSVDERTMTLSAGRLYIANPD